MAKYYVYILASQKRGTLYIGITRDIARRTYEHKEGLNKGFTNKYNVKRLVYVEEYDDVGFAIQREKNLKHWKRDWKIELIEKHNADWKDWYEVLNS